MTASQLAAPATHKRTRWRTAVAHLAMEVVAQHGGGCWAEYVAGYIARQHNWSIREGRRAVADAVDIGLLYAAPRPDGGGTLLLAVQLTSLPACPPANVQRHITQRSGARRDTSTPRRRSHEKERCRQMNPIPDLRVR